VQKGPKKWKNARKAGAEMGKIWNICRTLRQNISATADPIKPKLVFVPSGRMSSFWWIWLYYSIKCGKARKSRNKHGRQVLKWVKYDIFVWKWVLKVKYDPTSG
jgi:hypothetical protein